MSSSYPQSSYSEAYLKQNRGYQETVTTAVFGFLALVCVIGRLVARRMSRTSYGLDDYLIVASMFCGIGLVIVVCMLPAYGVGKHIEAVSRHDLEEIGKLSFAFQISFTVTLCLAKLSILALYHRIFSRSTGKWFRWSLWAIAVYIVLWFIGCFLDFFLECQPLDSMWYGGCGPDHATTITIGILDIVSDFAIYLLPQPIVWRLNMSARHKIGVTVLLVLGLFATVISIVRIPLSVATSDKGTTDITYKLIINNILTVLEPLIIIICACLPPMQVFIRHFFSGSGGGGRNENGNQRPKDRELSENSNESQYSARRMIKKALFGGSGSWSRTSADRREKEEEVGMGMGGPGRETNV